MSIFDHFNHLNLSLGQETALAKLEAFLSSPTQVFILKGYAGSGKTTLLKGLISHIEAVGKSHEVMAPTGRAAKVLRDKTGRGKTIHSSIYDFENVVSINANSEEFAEHSFKYLFPIKDLSNSEQIIIVDESSMISNKESKNELFSFGTDILLQDLLTYTKLTTTATKIIFVGDPAQLPPVTDYTSYALQNTFFEEKGLSCYEVELTHVHRQGDNLILTNATRLRELLKKIKRNTLEFNYDEHSFTKVNANDIPEMYVNQNPTPELGNGVVIAYSNTQTLAYNRAIREKYFTGHNTVLPGDLLMINNNNYRTYGVEIFNGDMAKVVSCSEFTTRQSTPVYIDQGGKPVKVTIVLSFRDVTIRLPHVDDEVTCKIIDSLLNNCDRDLTIPEMKALYINFVMRFKEQQQKNRDNGLPAYQVGSEQFKTQLMSDPFVNALRVKYGYAITCHKAQGGEWKDVFIDYFGRVGLKDAHLKWCYTATTRGANKCFVANSPQFSPLDQFEVGPVVQIAKMPANALNLQNVPLSPFHREDQHKCKSLKYWEVSEKAKEHSFLINEVTSPGPFLERYRLSYNDQEYIVQANHDGAGFFHPFSALPASPAPKFILDIINSPVSIEYSVNYTPSTEFLANLYSQVQGICNDLNIAITNIIESIPNYFITYYFKTSSKCSFIQFYFNSDNHFTSALPKSDIGVQDEKLAQFIIKIKEEYASQRN
jgi:hypothetical protein